MFAENSTGLMLQLVYSLFVELLFLPQSEIGWGDIGEELIH